MKSKRYLTKSRYKLALECPTKLFYTKKESEYEDQSLSNDFLKAIAKGGFQVGELAKYYYPGGHDIEALGYEESMSQTNDLLAQEDVTIFEAALSYENLFVRVDILEKNNNHVNLIEVKSKSVDPDTFFDDIKNGKSKKAFKLKADWKMYIYDLAFQTYVARLAHPEWTVTPCLMLSDKSKVATVDGLNQKFILKEVDGRTRVEVVGDVSPEALGDEVLCKIDLTEIIDKVINGEEFSGQIDGLNFKDGIAKYSKMYAEDSKIAPQVTSECKNCQYRSEDTSNLKSGFEECWRELNIINDSNKKGPFSFDIWFSPKLNELLEDKKYFMKDLSAEDIAPKKITDKGEKLSRYDRQCLQIEKVKNSDTKPHVNTHDLKKTMDSWVYPLHFIDFETSRVAIPFNKGRRPYEQMAFQFSHHQVDEDGKIWHRGEYLESTPGKFPNFDFIRALKKQLESDQGTIFRYSHHENTVLGEIHAQLTASSEPDKDELQCFIESITSKKASKDGSCPGWAAGERMMVDLCQVAEWFYYSPHTGGSLSLKYVLPAVLNESEFLQNKYSKAVYGTEWGIPSKNFSGVRWLQRGDGGEIINPYKQLPPVNGCGRDELDRLVSEDDIRNGGAAMTAYAMMQFSQMSDQERAELQSALLKYCELDTLAMVMIWEHWKSLVEAEAVSKTA